MKSFLRHLLLCCVTALTLAFTRGTAAGAEAANPPALVVGITWEQPGQVPAERAATLNRFEAELAIAVARTQGRRVTFRLGPLDMLLRELAEGRIDFVPGIARTPDRQKLFDFSVPHSRLATHLFVRRGNTSIVSSDDLRGQRIVVVKGSYAQEWAVQRGYGTLVIPVADLNEGVRRLEANEGDCLVAKQLNMFAAMQAAGVNDIVVRGPPVPGLLQDLCIAVRIGNRDLLAQINEGLFQLKQTGELDRIYEKWMGLLEPSSGPLVRFVRIVSFVAALLVVLAGVTWTAYRVQIRRTRARLAEIERRVVERTEELAAAKARYEAVVANTPAAIVLIDPHDAAVPGRIVDCNETTCRLHGFTRTELIGQSINRLRLEPLTSQQCAATAAELQGIHRRHGHSRHRSKDGAILEVEYYVTLLHLEGRELLLEVDLDVTDRLRAEAALRRTEEFQRLVLQASNDGIFDWDIAGDRFSLSAHGWQLLGFAEDELPGHRSSWWQRLHPDDRAAAEALLQRHFAEGVPFVHTARYLHKDGSVRWLYCRADTLRDDASRPVRMVGSYTDITELKRIDEELQLSRRLRAIGELVGGIAHEFNNLLTPILLQTSVLAEEKAFTAETAEQLESILDAARRAQALTRQLLQFGRHGDTGLKPQSLATIIDGTLGLVRTTIDRRIEIRAECQPALPPVRVNAVIMGQVVMNLVLNARDVLLEKLAAAPPGWRPQLALRLAAHTGPERGAHRAADAPAGQSWQRLSVADNGPGIRPEVRERMFEPFYTTKAVGKGTGLGLAMVWNTVEELGGWVDVESMPDQGTRFDLYFPSAVGATATGPAAPEPAVVAGPTRKRRLLLVEDDELVGGTVAAMLRNLGQVVVRVRNGDDALMALQDPVGFDAVLTDLNMPGLGGEELIARVRSAGYRGKLAVLSGLITAEVAQRLRAAGVATLVQKPFEFERMKALLEEL
ncbi:MAG TPA: transporter substrate-binding domain-containing protein [Opitutaceae bacterium]|nr:transporter substrate-binding domain-containing protein [Opitutaceae bacterium]